MEDAVLGLLDQWFKLPWPSVFAFFALLSLLLFTFGPKVPIIARFFASSIQELLGVTALRADMKVMHAENKANIARLDRRLDEHAELHSGETQ